MPPQPTDIVERIRSLRYVHVPVASQLMAEAASAIESLRWRLTVRENIIGRLVAENQRLRDGAVTGCETVCPHVRGTVTQHCSLNFTLTAEERLSVLHFSGHYAGFYGRAMHRLAMRLGLYDLPRDTPDTQATPGEGSVQDTCTLTAEEREAIDFAADFLDGRAVGATLRNLLERVGGGH
jgi:hypothetical protein